VQLVVHACRFFCDTPTCSRRIFVEPFPRVLARYARQTERWRQVLMELAHSSNAKMAARVALGHTILAIVYTLLTRKQPYQDLGATYFDSLVQQRVERRLVQRLERLGYQVSLQPSNL
jgi:hypothetical protein